MTREAMTNDPNTTDWAPCPDGTLKSLTNAHSDSAQSRRKFLSGLATGVAIGGIGIGALAFRQKSLPPGNLTCSQLAKFTPTYAAKQLNSSMSHRVELHLAKCSKCRDQYEQHYA